MYESWIVKNLEFSMLYFEFINKVLPLYLFSIIKTWSSLSTQTRKLLLFVHTNSVMLCYAVPDRGKYKIPHNGR
jgi:hypothetical protein